MSKIYHIKPKENRKLEFSTSVIFQIFYIIKHKKTVEKSTVLYYNRDKERVDRI